MFLTIHWLTMANISIADISINNYKEPINENLKSKEAMGESPLTMSVPAA